jgi:hypothetical protein
MGLEENHYLAEIKTGYFYYKSVLGHHFRKMLMDKMKSNI